MSPRDFPFRWSRSNRFSWISRAKVFGYRPSCFLYELCVFAWNSNQVPFYHDYSMLSAALIVFCQKLSKVVNQTFPGISSGGCKWRLARFLNWRCCRSWCRWGVFLFNNALKFSKEFPCRKSSFQAFDLAFRRNLVRLKSQKICWNWIHYTCYALHAQIRGKRLKLLNDPEVRVSSQLEL